MNNKKIFSFNIFLESLRQLRVIGFIIFAIITIEALMIPLSTYIDVKSALESTEPGTGIEIATMTATSMHPILVLSFLVCAPAMVFFLFSFINKRNSSDFYHSLPHTRLCTVLSMFTAVLAWIAFIIFGTTAISAFCFLLISKYVSVAWITLLAFSASVFIASIFAASATLIGCCLTGTTLPAVVLSYLIMYAPRLISYAVSRVIANATMIIPSSKIPFFGNGYNIITTWALNLFSGYPFSVFSSLKANIYTLIVGIIYALIGILLFIKRKSETAESAAPSSRLQAIYRIVIASVFCMVPCILIFQMLTGDDSYDTGLEILVLYLLIIVGYFAYEIITTRKLKNLLRAIPGLGILALVNAVIIGGFILAYHGILSYTPSEESIKEVYIVDSSENERYDMYGDWTVTFGEYVRDHSKSVSITSPEVNKIISNALKEETDAVKNDTFNKKYYGYVDYDPNKEEQEEYKAFGVKIRSGLFTRTRIIFVNSKDYKTIIEKLESNKEYLKMWTTIPEPIEGSGTFMNLQSYPEQFAKGQLKEVVDTINEELKTTEFEKWYESQKNNGPYAFYDIDPESVEIRYDTVEGLGTIKLRIIISKQILPKTYEKIIGIMEEAELRKETVRNQTLETLKGIAADPNNYGYYEIAIQLYENRINCNGINLYDSYEKYEGSFSISTWNGTDLGFKDPKSFVEALIKDWNNDRIDAEGKYMSVTVNFQDKDLNYKALACVIKVNDNSAFLPAYNDNQENPDK